MTREWLLVVSFFAAIVVVVALAIAGLVLGAQLRLWWHRRKER